MSNNHKETSRKLVESWGDNTSYKPDRFLAEGYVNHQLPDPAGGTSTKTRQEWKDLVADIHNSLSDLEVKVLLQVAEGDYVCSHWRATARQTGEFKTFAATGMTTTWTGTQIDRYENGKVVESWVNWDKYGFLEGLGLVS